MTDNYMDLFIAHISAHLQELRTMKKDQVINVVKELKKEPRVWASIPEGNRNYLEGVLAQNPTDKYIAGAIPHLQKALPHRLGFVAMEEDQIIRTGNATFDEVIKGKRNMLELRDEQLVQFLRDFYNNDKLRHHGIYKQNSRTISMWLEKYDRLHGNNPDEAKQYLQEKRPKIFNLFVRSIMPNLVGAIARQEIK